MQAQQTYRSLTAVLTLVACAGASNGADYTLVFDETFGATSDYPGQFNFSSSSVVFTVTGVRDEDVCLGLCSLNSSCVAVLLHIGDPGGGRWQDAPNASPVTTCVGLSDPGPLDSPAPCISLLCKSFTRNLVDECSNGLCSENGNCTDTLFSFLCSCNDGYDLLGGSCLDIDECGAGVVTCDPLTERCTNTAGSYACDCIPGFLSLDDGSGDSNTTGSCDDINECEISPCDHMATCTNTFGSFDCECIDGWSGNGTNCSNINECTQQSSCNVNTEECVDTPGSFSCRCKSGFSRTVENLCANINECSSDQHNCHRGATCQDTFGSFMCECTSGYTGDGVDCTDENECDSNSLCGDDPATCMNTEGSFECSCHPGWDYQDGECFNIYECDNPTACHSNATCDDTVGSFMCTCHVGFSGDGRRCRQLDYCAEQLHNCAHDRDCRMDFTSNTYHCICLPGFEWDELELSCNEINECDDNPCHMNASCSNLAGSFTCECNHGFVGTGTIPDGCVPNPTQSPTTSSPMSAAPTLPPTESPLTREPSAMPTDSSVGPSNSPSGLPTTAPTDTAPVPTSPCAPNIEIDQICAVAALTNQCCEIAFRGRCDQACCSIVCPRITIAPTSTTLLSSTSLLTSTKPRSSTSWSTVASAIPTVSPSIVPSVLPTHVPSVSPSTAATTEIVQSTNATSSETHVPSTTTMTTTSTTDTTVTKPTTIVTQVTSAVSKTDPFTKQPTHAPTGVDMAEVEEALSDSVVLLAVIILLAIWAKTIKKSDSVDITKKAKSDATVEDGIYGKEDVEKVPTQKKKKKKKSKKPSKSSGIMANPAYGNGDQPAMLSLDEQQRQQQVHDSERRNKLELQRNLLERDSQEENEARARAAARQKRAAEALAAEEAAHEAATRQKREQARARIMEKRRQAQEARRAAEKNVLETRREINAERAELTRVEMEAQDRELQRREDVKQLSRQ